MEHSGACECLPLVVMELVTGMPDNVRSLDRAAGKGDTFKGEKIKVGKKTCTCTIKFVLTKAGTKVDTKKSTASCDKKCPKGSAKNVKLGGPKGVANLYTFTMSSTGSKGKASITKATVVIADPTTTRPPSTKPPTLPPNPPPTSPSGPPVLPGTGTGTGTGFTG